MNNINVVYTPWANLKKTGDMDVGQIGFHRQRDVSNVTNHLTASTRVQVELTSKCSRFNAQVRTVAVEKKVNEIVNRLEKTKAERFPDLLAEKESRDREERNEKKAQLQEHKRREKEEQKKKKEMEELRWVCKVQQGKCNSLLMEFTSPTCWLVSFV